MLKKRELGGTGMQVPPIVLGGNVFGWTVQEEDAFRLLDRALDLGLNFIDTANVYSRWAPGNQGGESETILGRWIARSGKRERIILASKVGWDMGDGRKGLRSQYIRQAIEESLQRLQTDRIDLYFSHIDDPETPLEESLGAYQQLIKEGKIRAIGASNYSGARLRQALETSRRNGLPEYQVLQPLYNLLERHEYESDLAPVVEQYGLAVTPYFALASGFLTGKYRTEADLKDKARGSRVKKYLNDSALAVVDTLEEIARERHSTPASVAIAWLVQRPTITAAIASATNEKQLESLTEAAQLNLGADAMERLDRVSGRVAQAA